MTQRYKYEIEYLCIEETGGKHKRKKEVEFTKPESSWKISDYDTLNKYLKLQEKIRCDVSVINIKPIETRK